MQILHLARDSEVRPHHQARTPQTKADTTHLAPRFHPMGGSYPKTTRKGHGSDYIQDAQAAADTTPKTTEQPQGELLVEGCGRIAEFLAQAPWNEKREGLSATEPEIEQRLHSHNSICRRLTMMLEELPAATIPMADSKKLQQLHRILHQVMMPGWPVEWLQQEIIVAVSVWHDLRCFNPGLDVEVVHILETRGDAGRARCTLHFGGASIRSLTFQTRRVACSANMRSREGTCISGEIYCGSAFIATNPRTLP